MYAPRRHPGRRPGSILPMLAVCVTALFGFIALAVDLGMLMIARTECQNAADTAALTGARNLDGRVPAGTSPNAYDNNAPAALAAASAVLQNNVFLSTNFTAAQVTKVQVGVYDYLPAAQSFAPLYDAGRTNLAPRYGSGTKPTGKAWSCCRVEVDGTQPSYFGQIFGVATMPMAAYSVAVHRPRDIALVLDMTGSMHFSSETTWPVQGTVSGYLNPDPMYPQFGHYGRYTDASLYATDGTGTRWNPLRRTVPYTQASGEIAAPSNHTIPTRNGPTVVDGFRFDPSNVNTPGNVVSSTTQAALRNAFNRWSGAVPGGNCLPPVSVAGDPNNYVAPTYNFNGYNAFDTTSTNGPTPAPDNFGTQTDSGSITYVGDRYPRKWGATTSGTWSATDPNGAAVNLAEYLGWAPKFTGTWGTTFPGNPPSRTSRGGGAAYQTDWSDFRDATWEQYGYDLDVADYVANRPATYDPRTVWGSAKLKVTAQRFQGYSMGPGYWGKTFFIWPPDPRPANDWRRKFFYQANGSSAFDPQAADNDSSQTGNQPSIDATLLNQGTGTSGVGAHPLNTNSRYAINYSAVLAWIKTGPQTLPPNLRAGRIVYYSSIPSDVNFTAGSTAPADLDKQFWKNYIEFVLGDGSNNSAYDPRNNLAGTETTRWPEGASTSSPTATAQYDYDTTGPIPADALKPYTNYTFNPNRPRMHFWFGPASMMAFLSNRSSGYKNWWAGTLNEAQSWQLKAGVRSGIDDVQANHPNDQVGMAFFSWNSPTPMYNTTRVPMGQDYDSLKNSLFYPKSLLPVIKGGDTSTEVRPYNSGFGNALNGDVPNANGGTDPNSGFVMAYNLLSSSVTPNPDLTGRRGAAKVVIFETDGVPNSYQNWTYVPDGPNSYYTWTDAGNSPGNGDSYVMQTAIDVVTQIVAPVNNTAGTASGFSLPNAPARVYAIGFGDLFDPSVIPAPTFQPTALSFLLNVQKAGNTSAATDTSIPAYQIITGPYDTRIDNLRNALQRIFQNGVHVTLIE